MTILHKNTTPIIVIKKLLGLLLLILLSLFAHKVLAFDPFIYSPNNPLPITSNYADWTELGKYQPTALYENGIYKMWYASYSGTQFKIAYATSSDGIHFTGQNLLDLYPGFDNHDPAILKTQNGYSLFFVASTNIGSQNFKIYRIDSSDGITFDVNTRQLVLDPANAMESTGVSSPSVIFVNGTYYLFYLCWGNQGFRICMATSSDGISWQRCVNNPIISETSDGPSVLEKNGVNYLFFQSPLGIRLAETSDSLSCNSNWTNFQTLLPDPVIGLTALDLLNSLSLYYSVASPNGRAIHLATSDIQTTPTPTPTLSTEKNIIVFLPGLLASWNKDALLHNQQVGVSDWKLNPIVKEYNGIIATLANLDYQQNTDFFIFAYDWRKKISNIADDLRTFLNQNVFLAHPNVKVDLVGHSLGGLVTRIYSQKYGVDHIDKVLTVGAPHQGVAQIYPAVEAGEFDGIDTSLWLAQKIILQLNRNSLKTDKQILNEIAPVLKDLFPIYNFLTDQSNKPIQIKNMKVKNETLLNYSSSFSSLFPYLQTIFGEKGNTLSEFQVGPRTNLDKLLDLYPDGRPINKKNKIGDFTVISNSAKADSDFITLPLEHRELAYKELGMKTILNSLQIPSQNSQIVEGQPTTAFPSLLFLILSPATMEVQFGTQTFSEQDGIILIENAQNGDYLLKVMGQTQGTYTVIIGQIGNEKDNWSRIEGQISQNPPTSQVDSYNISFNQQDPIDFPINQNNILSLFDLLISRIKTTNTINNKNVKEVTSNLTLAKKYFGSSQALLLKKKLLETHEEIFENFAKTRINNDKLLDIIIEFENLYYKSLENFIPKPSSSTLFKQLGQYNKLIPRLEQSLLEKKEHGKNVVFEADMLVLAKEKLEKSKSALQSGNLSYAEILLQSVDELLD